jgi:hypothetical protein
MSGTIRVSLALLIAAAAISLALVGGATAQGVTPDQLTAAGWTCYLDPGAPRTVCADPGQGRPVPAEPDGALSYNLTVFALDGTYIGTLHLIRGDLYHGQPCPPSGAPYFFISRIGYYRCEHF